MTWKVKKHSRPICLIFRFYVISHDLSVEAIAGQFKQSPKVAIQAVLGALEELCMVSRKDDDYFRLAA